MKTRKSVQRMVRKLMSGKYKNSLTPCRSVAKDLHETLSAIGIAECDHFIAVVNMRKQA